MIGYDVDKFKQLVVNISNSSKEYQNVRTKLEDFEEAFIRDDPTQLIIWGEDQEIFGWIIWHASRVEDHGDGSPRDEIDKKILSKLIGPNEEFIELHELWLREKYRGKGYGKKIFDFFENFVLKKEFKHIVYYAFDPIAIQLCRGRGYKEEFNEQLKWYTLSKTF